MDIWPDPPRPFGDFKNPLRHPAGPRARRGARGDFQNPRTDEGDLTENPPTKSKLCTYFFPICWFNSKDYQPNTFQLQKVQQTNS